MIEKIKQALLEKADPEKAKLLSRYFKTGKGQYGEGDVFLGLISQQIKDVARKYSDLSLDDLTKLIQSEIHEDRTCALRILIKQFNKAKKDSDRRKQIVDFYLTNTKWINNWDLVDISAHYILGEWLLENKREILYKLVESNNLWERRIAIISCFSFIRRNDFSDALKISEILLKDEHDLIHKAVGWMLREIGKKNLEVEEEFLKKYYKQMPRTMLRYSIEKFSAEKRSFYMKKD